MSWTPSDATGECLRISEYGQPYEDLSCLYPKTLGWTYMQWENEFPFIKCYEWMVARPWAPVLAASIYCVMVRFLPRYMKKRDPFDQRIALAVWNIFVSAFSFFGWLRMSTQLMHNIYHYGVWGQLCYDQSSLIGPGTSGTWAALFVLSKMPEFLDTFFIIIHKKNLIFLHWYHHITALCCSWQAFVARSPIALFLAQMNYGVHVIMYFYYALMAMKCRPKWFNPQIITILQISQMWIGVFLAFAAFGTLVLAKDQCHSKPESIAFTMTIYGSYGILFLKFFFQRYAVTQDAKKKIAKKE